MYAYEVSCLQPTYGLLRLSETETTPGTLNAGEMVEDVEFWAKRKLIEEGCRPAVTR
jgi:hypothetical protein